VLDTLSPRQFRAGYAEVAKYGLLGDLGFFEWLEKNHDGIFSGGAAREHAVAASCRAKAGVVARDEYETGERALLNLGHTFGHAIESATNYTTWLHGEAVGAGMLLAADMSRRLGWVSEADVERVEGILRRFGLPVDVSAMSASALADKMKIDKKVAAGRIRLVLLKSIGKSVVTGDYADAALRETLQARCG
jgi:3-dehydroquinate synthase